MNDPDKAYYSEEMLVGYRWFDTRNIEVMYPFGYGLTYTTFEYSALNTDAEKYESKDVISLSFSLMNTGDMAADEVVQAYVHRVNPSVEWPEKELKAFSRVNVQPGEEKTVTLEIPVETLRYWDEINHDWKDDLCDIELQVGSSANDILLKKQVALGD